MRSHIATLLWITLIPLAVFAPTVLGPYVFFDDTLHIQNNAWLVNGEVAQFWRAPFFGLYIPVTYSVWSAIYALTSAPWGFHVFNVLLHALNSLLVWALVRRFVASNRVAALAALFFALHGLQVEPVGWISAGRDLLCGFFALSALLAVLGNKPLSFSAAFAGSIFFALALLAKPSIAPLPVVVLGFCLLPRGDWDRRRLALGVAWLVLSGLAIAKTMGIQAEFNSYRLSAVPLLQRILIAFDSLGFYLQKLIWPWPMIPDYGRTPQYVIHHQTWIWTGATVLVALAGLVLWRRRLGPVALFGFATAAVLLSPVLGFFPFSAQIFTTVSDRYMYLPLFAVALAVAPMAERSRLFFMILAGIVAVHALSSFRQATLWQSNRRIFSHTLDVQPNSYVALNALALSEWEEGQIPAAEKLFAAAWAAQPRLAVAPANLAAIWWASGRGNEILNRLVPYISDLDNVRFNRHETRALATLYVNLGRAQAQVKNWDKAKLYYCNYEFLELGKPAAEAEVRTFLETMTFATGKIASCAD